MVLLISMKSSAPTLMVPVIAFYGIWPEFPADIDTNEGEEFRILKC